LHYYYYYYYHHRNYILVAAYTCAIDYEVLWSFSLFLLNYSILLLLILIIKTWRILRLWTFPIRYLLSL